MTAPKRAMKAASSTGRPVGDVDEDHLAAGRGMGGGGLDPEIERFGRHVAGGGAGGGGRGAAAGVEEGRIGDDGGEVIRRRGRQRRGRCPWR